MKSLTTLNPLAKPNPKHHAAIMALAKDHEMDHVRGGNGWIIVQDLGDEMEALKLHAVKLNPAATALDHAKAKGLV